MPAPVAAIIKGLRGRGVDVPIIGFPRAADWDMADYVARTGFRFWPGSSADRKMIMSGLPEDVVLQGNLDPQILVRGGAEMRWTPSMPSSMISPTAISFSISGTVLCRKRRPSMWPSWWRWCAGRRFNDDTRFLADIYSWILAFHIIIVMFWMAGMYYLPRLFVYHAEAMENGEPYPCLK